MFLRKIIDSSKNKNSNGKLFYKHSLCYETSRKIKEKEKEYKYNKIYNMIKKII